MPDFMSSSLDFGGVVLDEAEAKKVVGETPVSLFVRYSLESLRGQGEKSRGRVSRIDAETSSCRDDEVSEKDSGRLNFVEHVRKRSHKSLRRVRAKEDFQVEERKGRNRANSHASSASSWSLGSTVETLYSDSEPVVDDGDGTEKILIDEDGPPAFARNLLRQDFEKCRIVSRFAHETPNLFGSFCIIDLQIPGCPVRVTSDDMLPGQAAAADDEAIFLIEGEFPVPWKLATVLEGGRTAQLLPFEGNLVDIRRYSVTADLTHRFKGQVELTDFIRNGPDDDPDIWLQIAYEEMEKEKIRITRRSKLPVPNHEPANKQRSTNAELAMDIMKSLHRDYFVIGVLPGVHGEPKFSITLASPTLAYSQDLLSDTFLDFSGELTEKLMTPVRFVTRVQWRTPGQRDRCYCVPMFGPGLNSWLCFLVDAELPNLWLEI